MINPNKPDYTNTPSQNRRPTFTYAPRTSGEPFVSILTPYYNVGPIFQETVRSVQQQSFPHWEWLIVDDGSTDATSLAQLERIAEREPRVRVLRQANTGPGIARNRAAANARGHYFLQLDTDDLMEPTFLEKALWLLETQPQFSACNSYNVTFGGKTLLWPYGFQQYEYSIDDNRMTMQAVIRRADWERIGGYDERVSYEHADWDFWLNLAEAGLWGYTLPEYLTWYRMRPGSLLQEIESDGARARAFRVWLRTKHKGLRARFPHPMMHDLLRDPEAELPIAPPLANPLAKPEGMRRLLLIAPWMEIGGADKFNLDLLQQLTVRGYECTVATTALSQDRWLSAFSRITPDIFRLHTFLTWSDYPRFLDYLIASRQIDVIMLSNSELGYGLLSYLRSRHPHVPVLDFNHLEEEDWNAGGYPSFSIQAGATIDLRLTCSDHLRHWMIARGAPEETIKTIYCGVDSTLGCEQQHSPETREGLGIADGTALILFAGRMVAQKRPWLVGEILRELAQTGAQFAAVVAGDGPELPKLRRLIARYDLSQRVRFLGALSAEEMRRLTAAADIALLPSQIEGIALTLYEAMGLGVVPVAADVGGQSELVTPECGYLIAQGDEEIAHYVAALQELITHPQRRREMAQVCRERVVERFDVRMTGEALDGAISQALDAPLTKPPTTQEAAQAAKIAVTEARRRERAEAPWARHHRVIWIAVARRVRERVIPFGSQRYQRYRTFRQALQRIYSVAS